MEEVEYLKDAKKFRTNYIGNSFGTVDEANKKVTLKLHGHASYFFMREGLFESSYYKFIKADSRGNRLTMEMIYNDEIEVSKLVQQWMSLISVVNDSDDAQKVIDRIKKNYGEFLDEI